MKKAQKSTLVRSLIGAGFFAGAVAAIPSAQAGGCNFEGHGGYSCTEESVDNTYRDASRIPSFTPKALYDYGSKLVNDYGRTMDTTNDDSEDSDNSSEDDDNN